MRLTATSFLKALAILGLLAGATGQSKAEVIVDQSWLTGQYLGGAAISNIYAQTFTVGVNGTLASVDLQLTKDPNFSQSNVTFAVMSTSGGIPNSVLYSTTINYSDLPTATFFAPTPLVNIDVSSANLTVLAGQVLALRVFGGGIWATHDDPQVDYVGGDPYRFNGGVWQKQSFSDFGFRTFVLTAPAVVPEPSSLVLCGLAGVIGLAVARSRCKRVAC